MIYKLYKRSERLNDVTYKGLCSFGNAKVGEAKVSEAKFGEAKVGEAKRRLTFFFFFFFFFFFLVTLCRRLEKRKFTRTFSKKQRSVNKII